MAGGSSAGRFLVEFDGIAACRASEVTGLEQKHEPFEINPGDVDHPEYGMAKFKNEAVVIKHAIAINNSGREFAKWYDNYRLGAEGKRSFRVVMLGSDGRTPTGFADLIDCTPTSFKFDDFKGDSKDAVYFSITVQPENMIIDL
jgi:phage tail-like protein